MNVLYKFLNSNLIIFIFFIIILFCSNCSHIDSVPRDRLNHPYMNFKNDLITKRSSPLTGLNTFNELKGNGSACTTCAK
ncbi:MAG: hypothetical protein HQK49_12700 [Oligoflexia bacterium]|nr:hypothetical protein [Oligoflexia bacterium]